MAGSPCARLIQSDALSNSCALDPRASMSSTALTMPVSSRVDKGIGDIDIFGNDHARRNVRLAERVRQRPARQHRAQQRLHPLQRPALGERLVDRRIELALVGGPRPSRCRGRRRPRLADICSPSTSPPSLWLSNWAKISFKIGAGDVHLIERLDGGEPRGTAPVGFCGLSLPSLAACCLPSSGLCQPAFDAQHRQRRARGVAALVQLAGARRAPRPAPRC